MAEGAVALVLSKLSNVLDNEIPLFRNVMEDIIEVREELASIRAFLATADSLAESNEEVRVWVEQIRDLAYKIEDVLDEFELLSFPERGDCDGDGDGFPGILRRLGGSIRNMKARYRLTGHLQSVSSRLRSVCERHRALHRSFGSKGPHQQDRLLSCESGDKPPRPYQSDSSSLDVVGLEEPKRTLIQWLIGGPARMEVTSVVGMGGLGKTTLIKQVYDDPAVKKHFVIRAWVSLSPSFETGEVLEDMLQQIGGRISMKAAPKRGSTSNADWLSLMIKGCLLNRRYLIVLDDVWHLSKWDAIKYAFPGNGCESRVILSTRNSVIASAASGADFGGKVYSLLPLPDQESWELLCKKTFRENNSECPCPPHLEGIGKAILRKCMGLPLAIVAISGVLASQGTHRIDKWDLIWRSLRAEMDGDDKLRKILRVLSLSFNDLPFYLKSCFLYLSLFAEGQGIEVTRLIRLWVAEGFVQARQGRTLEEVAEDYLSELLDRSLLQAVDKKPDGRTKVCRVHNIIQQIAVTKSKEQKFAARVDERIALWPDNVRRLSVHNSSPSLEQSRSFSQLRSLFMTRVDNFSIKAVLRCHLRLLAVLDLQAAPLRKFPVQVCDMCFLKYLSLRCTNVSAVPRSIGKLRNLETLDLKHTYVTELPTEIMKLQRLRHLLVYRYENISYSHFKYGFRTAAEIGALQCLQKLSYIEADADKSSAIARDIGKLTQLNRLCVLKLKQEDGAALCFSIAKLRNLRSLSLSSSRDDEVLDLQHLVSPPPSLQRIYLRGRLPAMPHWIPTLQSLAVLHLRWCRLKDDPLSSLQGLPGLVHLELQQAYDWTVLHFGARGFTKLKTLGLDSFSNLRGIEVEEGAMPNLVQLAVQQCKLLQDIPSGIEHLTKLRVLEFFDVHGELIRKLKILDDQSEDYRKVAHIPEIRYGLWTDGGLDVGSVEGSK